MKKLIIITISLVLGLGQLSFSQQDPQFSQNMFNHMTINPGYAGMKDLLCAKLFYRTQWIGWNGQPKTMLFNVDGPIKRIPGGVGLTILKDEIGQYSFTKIRANFAYHYYLPNGAKVGFGGRFSITDVGVSNNWIPPDTPIGDDQAINDEFIDDIFLNGGFGLTYIDPDKMHFGVSISQIAPSKIDGIGVNAETSKHIYLSGGYELKLDGQNLLLKPQVFVKTDLKIAQLDINCILEKKIKGGKDVWGGFSYRHDDAIVPMIGFQFLKDPDDKWFADFGYAYDITTSEVRNHSNNTHEIFLGLCVKLIIEPNVYIYKDVRTL